MPLKDRLAELRSKQGIVNEGVTADESTTDPQFTAIEMDARANTASVSTGAANGASKNAAQRDMERFLEWVDETQDVLDKIRDVVRRVKQRHDQLISLEATVSDTEREHLSDDLDEFMADVKRNATRVRQKIAQLNGLIQKDQRAPPESVNQANLRIKQAQHAALSRSFTDIMQEYSNAQASYRDRKKELLQHQLAITGVQTSKEEFDDMMEQPGAQVFTQDMRSVLDAKEQLRAVESRHAEILKLERSIIELHDLFVDVAQLVETQGEMVDNIEQNVNSATDKVEVANTELHQARTYQSAARKKMILIGICIVITLIILAIILFFVIKAIIK
jgi:t-SNARE complex subunit (syntaxin)